MGRSPYKMTCFFDKFLRYTTIYLSIYSKIIDAKYLFGQSRNLVSDINGTCIYSPYYNADIIDLYGDDTSTEVSLPFSFPFYQNTYNSIGVSTNGLITLGTISNIYNNVIIPSVSVPNNFIAVFWTDLIVNSKTIFIYKTESNAIIQWTNIGFYGTEIPLGTFQSILYANGTIQLRYITLMGSDMSFGSTATIGIENHSGMDGICISFRTASLVPGTLYTFTYNVNTNSYTYDYIIDDNHIILLPNTMPKIPNLIAPYYNMVFSANSVITFIWNSDGANYYKLYVSLDDLLAYIVYQNNELYLDTQDIANLTSSIYYWKVYACNIYGCTESCIQPFIIEDFAIPPPPPSPPPSPSPSSPPPPSPPPPSPPPPSPPPPSPPPPSPPPPSPPPPSPPPPTPPSPISDVVVIQQIATVMTTAITTVVATSVSSVIVSSVAGSVGGSIGGASSVPSPAGLVSMIATVQAMNMKMNLQIGGTPDKIKGLASGIGWINLDFSLPKNTNSRRLLLQEETRNPYEQAGSLFVYSILLFLLPLSIIHYCSQHYLVSKKEKKIIGIMLFPQIELTIAMLLISPYGKIAASLFLLRTPASIFAGFGMLCVIPIPLIILSIYAIKRYIINYRILKYVEFKHEYTKGGIIRLVRQAILASPSKGYWKSKDHHLMDMYGIFFKTIRGPVYTFKDKIVRYDSQKGVYKWGKVIKIHDRFEYIRTYYKAYFILRVLLISILLNAFPYSTDGDMVQTILLIIFVSIHVYFMLFVSPLNTPKDQLVDVTSNICELGFYSSGFCILMARRLHLEKIITMTENAMFVFQILTVGVQIISQLWNVVFIFNLIQSMIREKFYKNRIIYTSYHILLVKKYANRWLLYVHHRPLKGWADAFMSKSKV